MSSIIASVRSSARAALIRARVAGVRAHQNILDLILGMPPHGARGLAARQPGGGVQAAVGDAGVGSGAPRGLPRPLSDAGRARSILVCSVVGSG
jgi:hypothetical protein